MRYVPIRQQKFMEVRVLDWQTRAYLVFTNDEHHYHMSWYSDEYPWPTATDWGYTRWDPTHPDHKCGWVTNWGLTVRRAVLLAAQMYQGLSAEEALATLTSSHWGVFAGRPCDDGNPSGPRFQVTFETNDRWAFEQRREQQRKRAEFIERCAMSSKVRFVPRQHPPASGSGGGAG